MDIQIPDKLLFKIGEVSSITGVKPHVLRYWESEFGCFSPSKGRSKQRQYKKKDIELVLRLKHLLYHEGFTIAGARKALRSSVRSNSDVVDDRVLLQQVRDELAALRKMIG